MATIEVACVHCSHTKGVVRNGKASYGLQRYYCRTCKRSFQIDFLYNTNKPGVRERIVEMAMNGSGVRDTGRVLEISPTTVISHLKSMHPTG